jgi:hypothetical protein
VAQRPLPINNNVFIAGVRLHVPVHKSKKQRYCAGELLSEVKSYSGMDYKKTNTDTDREKVYGQGLSEVQYYEITELAYIRSSN